MKTDRFDVVPLLPQWGKWAYNLERASGPDGYLRAPGPDYRYEDLWRGAYPFAVIAGGQPRVLLTVYSWNRCNRTVHLAATSEPAVRRTGITIWATAVLLHELFTNWNQRIVYLEANSQSERQFRSLIGTLFDEQARLPGYYQHPAGALDKVILALPRNRWLQDWAQRLS